MNRCPYPASTPSCQGDDTALPAILALPPQKLNPLEADTLPSITFILFPPRLQALLLSSGSLPFDNDIG
jgi:hypothetical protein